MNFFEFSEFVSKNPAPKLKLQWEYNTDTFKSWYMSEVTTKIVKELDKWKDENPDDMPFQSAFEAEDDPETTRIIIPFKVDPNVTSILQKLQYSGQQVDFDNGTITTPATEKTIKDKDGTTRQVTVAPRVNKLGKYILGNNDFSPAEKNWWNHAGDAAEELYNAHMAQDYSIVVSRNPVDIARMSDHDGWTSCHAPHREYFTCAIADAKGGGAVAYVVTKKSLQNVDLQAPEIFGDKARGVQGIKPISRVRLRKFVHKKDGYDLAVPEDRIYGTQFPGLETSVRDWAVKAQQDKLQGGRPRMKDFKLMGGSYQDTLASKLFNFMFDDNLDKGQADYGGEGEGQQMYDQYEEEVERVKRDFEGKFTWCHFDATVEESDGQPYVSYSGSLHFSIPPELSLVEPRSIGDERNWEEERKLTRQIEAWAKENDIYYVGNVHIDNDDVYIDISDHSGMTPDDFRSFLDDTLMDHEKKKDELQASFYHYMIELGRAKPNKVHQISNNWDDHPHQFKNFDWEGEEPAVMISTKQPFIFTSNKTAAGHQYEYLYWKEMLTDTLKKELYTWADRVFAARDKQPTLFHQPGEEPESTHVPFNKEFKIQPEIQIRKHNPPGAYNPNAPEQYQISMHIDFEPMAKDADVEHAIKFIEFLDQNYDKFVNTVNKVHSQWASQWKEPRQTPVPQQQEPQQPAQQQVQPQQPVQNNQPETLS